MNLEVTCSSHSTPGTILKAGCRTDWCIMPAQWLLPIVVMNICPKLEMVEEYMQAVQTYEVLEITFITCLVQVRY
jgi:hypothetical protein